MPYAISMLRALASSVNLFFSELISETIIKMIFNLP